MRSLPSTVTCVIVLTLFLVHAPYVATFTSRLNQSPFNDRTHSTSKEIDKTENDLSYVPLFMSRKLLQTCSTNTLPMPTQSEAYSYNGHVRGYYFQAPTNFAITGITIPTTASTSSSTAAIVRFNSGAPPVYNSTTNDFTQLGYWIESSATTISTDCICVESGQWIGILGYRGTTNSYGSGPYSTTIAGYSVTLSRSGMQYDLTTTAPQNLWADTSTSIGRVHFEYTTCGSTCGTTCGFLSASPTNNPTNNPTNPTKFPTISPTNNTKYPTTAPTTSVDSLSDSSDSNDGALMSENEFDKKYTKRSSDSSDSNDGALMSENEFDNGMYNGNNNNEISETITVNLSDQSIFNLWGLFGAFAAVNIIACWCYYKRNQKNVNFVHENASPNIDL